MKKAAIYYRVSTTDQNVDGQLDELRSYAEKRDFASEEFIDQGVSGAARNRPELDRLMGGVRQRKFDVVLVWAFDRFARSTSHLVTTLEELEALGVDFVSYSQQIDTTTPSGKLTFTVLAAIAEFERSMISERVKTGMAAAKKRGRHLGRPHLAKAKAEKIRQLRESGLSFRKIADQINVSVGTAVAYCK